MKTWELGSVFLGSYDEVIPFLLKNIISLSNFWDVFEFKLLNDSLFCCPAYFSLFYDFTKKKGLFLYIEILNAIAWLTNL